MISYLSGTVIEKYPTNVVVDVNGIGYQIFVSLNTSSQLEVGKNISLHTHFHVRENTQSLYGFLDQKERSVFRILISVSGISVTTGMMMMSTLTSSELVQAILNDDENKIVSIKGIGLKTAKKLILESRDKLAKEHGLGSFKEVQSSENIVKQQALTALENLGISKRLAEKKCDEILKTDSGILLEDLIRQVLKKLQA